MCRDDHPDRWKLLFGHNPVYNSGHHRNDGQERRTRATVEQPLILACGIDLYLAGHAHHQEHLTARGFEQVIQGPPRDPKAATIHVMSPTSVSVSFRERLALHL